MPGWSADGRTTGAAAGDNPGGRTWARSVQEGSAPVGGGEFLSTIDKTWTLFLDRDGVINHEKDQSYVFHYGEFTFYDDTKEALRLLAATFGPIVVVTNQRGIGKGLMTEKDLQDPHGNGP